MKFAMQLVGKDLARGGGRRAAIWDLERRNTSNSSIVQYISSFDDLRVGLTVGLDGSS